MVARDSDGGLIEAKAVAHSQLSDPVVEEAMRVKEVLSWIKHMKWPIVMLKSDCLVVV